MVGNHAADRRRRIARISAWGSPEPHGASCAEIRDWIGIPLQDKPKTNKRRCFALKPARDRPRQKIQLGDVTSVAFSPDGRTALSGSASDITLKLWDVATGKLVRTFERTSRGVRRCRAALQAVAGDPEKNARPRPPRFRGFAERSCGSVPTSGSLCRCRALFKRSLAIQEKALGPDHPDVATSLSGLADLYQDEGRYADAEPLYKRSLGIKEKVLGPDHPGVATSLNGLANLYQTEGRYADAELLYQRSSAIQEKALGPDHPYVATSLNNLAILHEHRGRYADAEPLLKRSLAIREKAFGSDHHEFATSLQDLANSGRGLARPQIRDYCSALRAKHENTTRK
jgi:hypothetical protein